MESDVFLLLENGLSEKCVFKYFYMICNPMFFYYLKNGLSESGSICIYSYMHIYIYICSNDSDRA